jgi:hypothetical protein
LTAILRSFFLVLSVSLRVYAQVVPNQPDDPVMPPSPGLLERTLTAKKLTPDEKFQYRVVEQFGIRGFLGTAISAAIGQGLDVPDAWGPHWDGYGKRYASGFGVGISRQVFALGLDDLLHQDPRYFPSSQLAFKPRFENVFKQVLVAKQDNGHASVASSRILSAFGAGFLANAWQPKGHRSVEDGLERGALSLAGNAAFFFLQEFVPFTRNSAFRHHR